MLELRFLVFLLGASCGLALGLGLAVPLADLLLDLLGDLVDRGPRSLDTLQLVMNMDSQATALCVPGNHDVKFLRWLNGKNVRITHGLETSVSEVEACEESNLDQAGELTRTFHED